MIQLALAANALWLGIILIDPTPTFPTALGYRWMAEHGTEVHWGEACLCVFAVAMAGVLGRGRHVRAFAAFVSSLLTGVIGLGFYLSNPAGTGSGTYAILTALSYWLLWQRLFRNA